MPRNPIGIMGRSQFHRCDRALEAGNHGKIVAIDIETGIFEVADDILTASDRLFERLPDAQPWIVRIGSRAVHRFGTQNIRM
ncbi:hypothetical protein JJD41_13205 [Oxynema sp. CENA135]|uniref:hypothetical protein n=1 Tax=Oxynema sp. CENA135 TaxID=984206 RepID=UPI00190B586E|nr:hypothetical protein [Oxynema sp. CENA135]MBK4730814.1 hypothetical protein [Oxynema sp. CENA135]